ncbi:signal recognition particle, SRP19 subunit [Hesseltinella vesiculosa]|uniref:Signal recognition particle, SRP19 subunit n=1 Tax=Hesseltinella vesiculosa TaxID=101127 RepID=A0A1X2GBN7_9FUNG|nr:signal recognition particle, SRP19 subunit [Hesseltinella vesiculosa]ORX50096.1 signal recognition particle, SRP19 subunit [Hesseltinella vesiculosa]
MSMLNKLKETAVNPVFMDEDDDVDNMDFELPSDLPTSSSSHEQSINDLQRRMQQMTTEPTHVAVASGPQGVRRLNPSEYKNWVMVYPCYIDAAKTNSQGRKIGKAMAVNNPHAYHMAVAVQQLGLNVVYESKRHPRDWANPGRVRVELMGPNKFFRNQEITSRKQLYNAIAARLPQVQKTNDIPKGIISPITPLAEVEALADEQRRAQGLPTLADMKAQAEAQQATAPRAVPKKQKVKYVRG